MAESSRSRSRHCHQGRLDPARATSAALLPGMAEIMPLVGQPDSQVLLCAGKAGNKVLARFQLAEAVNLMEKGAILRPKYTDNMDKFIAESVACRCETAIEAEDWAGFETAFVAMIEQANANHEFYDKSFLRWKMPEEPPSDLDLTAT